jgi:hypothetical protein
MHGDEARFMEINSKASSQHEVVKNIFKLMGRINVGPTEDKGVISVLQHRARQIGG